MQDIYENEVKHNLSELLAVASHNYLLVSGGVDSMCLLHMVNKFVRESITPYAVKVIHFTHNTREEPEALNFEIEASRLVKKFVEHSTNFQFEDVVLACELSETSMRNARKNYFNSIQTENVKRAFTGHHAIDYAVTILQRLLRGTHLQDSKIKSMDMLSINLETGLHTARPLLTIPKASLLNYAAVNGIPYLEDPLNQGNNDRAILENKVIPYIEEVFDRNVTGPLSRLALSCYSTGTSIPQHTPSTTIYSPKITPYSKLYSAIIDMDLGFTYRQINEVIKMLRRGKSCSRSIGKYMVEICIMNKVFSLIQCERL